MGIEQDTRGFLILIVNTIALVLIFLLAGIFFGIYLEYAFFEDSPTWKNWIFYFAYAVLFVLLLRKLRKKWKI